MTLLPSAKTAYPVTGTCFDETIAVFNVVGIQVTSIVPSCGPPSTRTSIGGSGMAGNHNNVISLLTKWDTPLDLPLFKVLNSVCADSFSSSRDKLFSSTKGEALIFFALEQILA